MNPKSPATILILSQDGHPGQVFAVTFDGALLPSFHDSAGAPQRPQMEPLESTVKHMALIAQPEHKLVQRADSVAAVVVQAIHSADSLLLEHALQSGGDLKLIDRTVQELPCQAVVPFLQAVIERIVRRPARAVELVRWVTSILQQHTGYLMAVPEVALTLDHLHAQLSARTKPLESLLGLHGRLQLLLAHDNTGTEDQQPGPLVHNEGSDGDDSEDDEDVHGGSGLSGSDSDSEEVDEMDGELSGDGYDDSDHHDDLDHDDF